MEENSKNIDLTVNPENSVINWKGYMPGGSHNGSVKIKQGHITFSEDIPVEGEVVIDMSSIKDFDLGDELKPTIENHLKSKDFFDVEHFPVATVRSEENTSEIQSH